MADRRRPRGAPDNRPDANAPDASSFEESLQRLESIVDRLERGDLELEDALATFEEGVKLTRSCASRLEDAERRIELLVREGEQWIARPFDASAESREPDEADELEGSEDPEDED